MCGVPGKLVFSAWRPTDLPWRSRHPVAASLAVHCAERIHPDGAWRARQVGGQRSPRRMPRASEKEGGGHVTARKGLVTTPGTRVTFSDVRGWMDGFLRIHRRPPATQRHVQLRAHVAVLTRELIAQEDDPEVLEALRDLFQEPKSGLKPARGAREGSAYELAVTAVHDRLVALRRPPCRPTGPARPLLAPLPGPGPSWAEGVAPPADLPQDADLLI